MNEIIELSQKEIIFIVGGNSAASQKTPDTTNSGFSTIELALLGTGLSVTALLAIGITTGVLIGSIVTICALKCQRYRRHRMKQAAIAFAVVNFAMTVGGDANGMGDMELGSGWSL